MNSTATAAPAILSISSHVVRGAVGNRSAVFAFEELGFPVWSVPTVMLAWHPGHGKATRIVPDEAAFAAMMNEMQSSPFSAEIGAVMTGYFGSATQVEPVANLIRSLKASRPELVYLCDPVIGDAAGLYVPTATATAIREHLLPLADIITPNRFELEWLAEKSLPDNNALAETALSFGAGRALVTSAHAMMNDTIANLLVERTSTMLIEHRLLKGPSNGLGDLTSALFLARLMKGESGEAAAKHATSSVFEVMASAAKAGLDELQLATDASSLNYPMAMVQTRKLFRPVKRVKQGSETGTKNQIDKTIVGIDGCKAGWIAVWRDGFDGVPKVEVFPKFEKLVDHFPKDAIIAVDMPIGLPDFIHGGGRGPEQAVRPHLKDRQSSVFSVPSRSAVHAEAGQVLTQADIIAAHKRASAVALQTSNPPRKISIQAFMLFPKIREIDTLLRQKPELTARIFESHPEFAFMVLNGGSPMSLPKKIKGRINPEGMNERRTLLARHAIPRSFLDQKPPKGAGEDDFLDACAMLLISERIAAGKARPHPEPLQHDSHGLPVSIWA